MALTKIPIELISGEGRPNKLIQSNGVNFCVSDKSPKFGISIDVISYSETEGVLTVQLSNGESLSIRGFVIATDLRLGMQGFAGRSGVNGLNGVNGRSAIMGAQGPTGFTGLNGAKGKLGPKGSQGAQGPTGYDGKQGKRGKRGAKGKEGKRGKEGAQGRDGRNRILPIVISETDPGAIGAGSLWIKPTTFSLADPVNFTFEHSQSALCQDTIRSARLNAMNVWSSNSTRSTYAFAGEFIAALSNKQQVMLLVNYYNGTKNETCLTTVSGKVVLRFDTQLTIPKCASSETAMFIIDGGILYTIINDSITQTELLVSMATSLLYHNQKLYITTYSGLFAFDIESQILSKLFDCACFNVIAHYNFFYIQRDVDILRTDFAGHETIINGTVIKADVLVFVNCANGLTIFSESGSLLWHDANYVLCENYIRKNSIVAKITSVGPQYITDCSEQCAVQNNILIEYSKNEIYTTEI